MSIDSRDYAGEPKTVITWNNHTIVLPISESELAIHPELQQNPGY